MIRRAAVLAVFMVAVFFGMRLTVGRATPIAVPLAELPLSIDEWTGSDDQVSSRMIARARPASAIARRYRNRDGQSVQLYAGYYERQASQGSVLLACEGECDVTASKTTTLGTAQGQIAVAEAVVSQEGGTAAVVYWLQEGRHAAPPSSGFRLHQARLTLMRGRSEGMAVRISAPVTTRMEAAQDRVLAFARALYPHLSRHLPPRPE
jgi:EpsI family protein